MNLFGNVRRPSVPKPQITEEELLQLCQKWLEDQYELRYRGETTDRFRGELARVVLYEVGDFDPLGSKIIQNICEAVLPFDNVREVFNFLYDYDYMGTITRNGEQQ